MTATKSKVPASPCENKAPSLLTYEQVAKRLNVDRNTVVRLVSGGDLRAMLISPGGQWRVASDDLNAYVEQAYATAEDVIGIINSFEESQNPRRKNANGLRLRHRLR